MDTGTLSKYLEALHDPEHWAFFVEQRVGTGYGKDSQQSFDAWAINYSKGKRNVTRCYELKISRSDFLHEIKKPLKRRAGLRLSNEFYFIVPTDLVRKEEIPPECGLMYVDDDGKPTVIIEAPYRESFPTWQFVASVCRRLDASRFLNAHAKTKAEAVLKMSEMATRIALERHIRKWRGHNVGSREIPDKILDAMEDLKREVDEIIRIQSGKVEGI